MASAAQRRIRRILSRAGTVVAVAAVAGVGLPAVHASAAPVSINILTINDFHGRIDGNTLRFAGTIETLRQAAGADNTLVVGAGDMIGASLFASASQDDQPTIDVMNEIGVNTSAVGNHEFDKGFADLTDRVIGPAGDRNAEWEYLGANVYEKGTTTPALPEYDLLTVQGLTVGVIGVVTQETPSLVSPSGVADLDFGDPVDAINRVAAQLSDGDDANGEADVLIATLHEGAKQGTADGGTLENQVAASPVFAHIVNDTSPLVDAIVNGHTHQAYAFDGPIPGQAGKYRPIIQTGLYGANVGQIQFTVDDADNSITSYTVQNVPTIASTSDDDDTAETENAALDAQLLADFPDPLVAVNDTVQAALAEAEIIGGQPVGSVAADITTAFTGGAYTGGFYTGGTRDDRASESTLGNEVANSLVSSLSDPDRGGATIGVVNPGGLRAELFKGDDGVITYAEANAVLPFVNNLWTMDITGAQFKEILEQQWQTNEDGTVPSRPYLQLGLSNNVTYTYDVAAAQGEHITSVMVDDLPLLADSVYRVGTFSFLAEGGDNFRAFQGATNIKDSGLIDRDAWIAYLGENPNLEPDFARHAVAATGLNTAMPGPGGTATLGFSGLDLTSLGSPQNTTLTGRLVTLADTPVITELGDYEVLSGAATVSFTVPAAGAYYLVLAAAPTGTTITLPVLVVDATTTATSTPTTTTPTTTVTTTTTRPTKGGDLASTGISQEASVGASTLAAGLITVGVLLVLLTRRRRVGHKH